MEDELFAKHVATLCDKCLLRPSTPGHDWCTPCYNATRARLCLLCKLATPLGGFDQICDPCLDVNPPEDATFEMLHEWTRLREARAPLKASSFLPTRHASLAGECAVCLSEIAVGQKVNVLSCSHVYHEECLRPWWGVHQVCPMCRA